MIGFDDESDDGGFGMNVLGVMDRESSRYWNWNKLFWVGLSPCVRIEDERMGIPMNDERKDICMGSWIVR